jgi:oligopeptide transport system ATP-binding protein
VNSREAHALAVDLLKLVQIPGAEQRMKAYPHELSGGMRQRICIAMALANDPEILIADEPTTALDVTIQAQIIDLVLRLREQFGMALIWITHDLGVVAGLAERVNVMYAGYLVETGPVDEIYGTPRHPYTRSLLKSLPRLDGQHGEQLETIEGMPPDLIQLPPGCPFAARCDFVKDVCRESNPPLEEISSGHKLACWVDVDTGGLR